MDFYTYFEVPEVGKGIVNLMVTELEKGVINHIKDDKYSLVQLAKWLKDKFYCEKPENEVAVMYKRAVLEKVEDNEEIYYKVTKFSERLSYFCQYEKDTWLSVPEDIRQLIDDWFVGIYAESAKERLEEINKGERKLIENAYFFTLEETLNLVDSLEKDIYLVPCNCRSIASNCDKPDNTCLLIEYGINTQWDRGYGKELSKEEAKDIVREADKNGLMHTSETDEAICNCCGCCCYPIRASKLINTVGLWPKRGYNIIWDNSKCINCGKCAKTCNFDAFVMENKKVTFNEEKCIGCTLCESHCPVTAITLKNLMIKT
jgi:NAD-dependent dihydropyrimidine dehydrogenase PreA subunit